MKKSAGYLIGLFYFLAVVLGVVLLAAGQFRSSSGSAFDTWRYNYDSNRELVTSLKDRLDALERQASSKKNWLIFTAQCLNLFDPSGKPKSGIDEATLAEVKKARSDRIMVDDMPFGDARCIYRGFTMLKADMDFYAKDLGETEREIVTCQKLLPPAEAQLAELARGHQDFLALKEMEKTWYTKLLVCLPYDLLVLLMVMAMGTLGGIIRILRDYGDPKRNNPSQRDYFVIPLIGAVVAIGGYILAKTGLLLLSSTQGETSLSPFTIGLVGIVSGLLAKEVIDRIAAYGGEMIKGKKE
jgi:hypothetical protein